MDHKNMTFDRKIQSGGQMAWYHRYYRRNIAVFNIVIQSEYWLTSYRYQVNLFFCHLINKNTGKIKCFLSTSTQKREKKEERHILTEHLFMLSSSFSS